MYTEIDQAGAGILMENAFPIEDSQGKLLTGSKNVFNFKITSTTFKKKAINYEITLRKKAESNLDEKAIKVYLTEVVGEKEYEVVLDKYSKLEPTKVVIPTGIVEKTLYKGKVPSNSSYEKNYRLRMWVDEKADFSPDSSDNYPYNEKSFAVTVNVYANGRVITDTELENENKAEIQHIYAGNNIEKKELKSVTGKDYQYETTLSQGMLETELEIQTIDEYANVIVERLDKLAYSGLQINQMSTKKSFKLNPGNNYFKITVKGLDGKTENEYKINIRVLISAEEVGYTENSKTSCNSVECSLNELYKILRGEIEYEED